MIDDNSPDEELAEEEKFPFCMKCKSEIGKKGARFCPQCKWLVLYYTKKQISTFKNQKKQKKDADSKSVEEEKSKPARNIPRLLDEEEFNPQLPQPNQQLFEEEI